MADRQGPIPKILYEVLPYFYGSFALLILYFNEQFVIQLVAWLIYAAGAIIFALRADQRRVNRKEWDRNRRLVNLPEDLYELLPFFALGIAVIWLKHPEQPTTFAGGLILLSYGLVVLAVRIVKREISWVHEWQRHHRSQADSEVDLDSRPPPGHIVYCDRCPSKTQCRTTGLSDKANAALMHWLQGSGSEASRRQLRKSLHRIESRDIPEEQLRRAVIKLRAYEDSCLAWGIRQ